MQRVSPPDRVKPSFDLVNASLQDRDRFRSEAENERNKRIPDAKATKDKLIREAEGYADKKRAEANGEIAALLAKYRAYQKAPEVTRQRLYLEGMQEVLKKVPAKTIIDADLDRLLPLLPLQPGGAP
jgi:membrane protease subunit HflK